MRSEAAAVCTDPIAFRLLAAACAACLAAVALWASAELRRARVRLRTAEAELQEADECLAVTGELLEHYEEAFGPLPFNPFEPDAAGDDQAGATDEWPM